MATRVLTPFQNYRMQYPVNLKKFLTRNPDATELDFLDRELKLNDSVIHEFENQNRVSSGDASVLMPSEAEYYTALRKDEFLWSRKKELLPDVSFLFEDAEEMMSGKTAPIKWHGTLGQLIYLFERLREHNFFPLNADLQADIRKHFMNADGKHYENTKQVKQNYMNTKTGKPKRAKELENIVAEMLKRI